MGEGRYDRGGGMGDLVSTILGCVCVCVKSEGHAYDMHFSGVSYIRGMISLKRDVKFGISLNTGDNKCRDHSYQCVDMQC